MKDNEDFIMGENELKSELTGLNKGESSSKRVKIILSIGIASLLIISIILIIVLITNNRNSKNEKKDILAKINCLYNIQNINKESIILGNEFNKISNFDIYINGQKIKYSKVYKFHNIGINKVRFDIYEDLEMDYMFKDVQEIISVEMFSEKYCKIHSMISTFENALYLEKIEIKGFDTSNEIEIKGFDTSNVKSMKKLFYSTSISEIDISEINTKNVLDMSYMFSNTDIGRINLTNFNTSKVENMSHMFQQCNSLYDIDISKFNTEKVKDMSYMFYFCSSLTSLDFSNFNTQNTINMSHMFQECLFLKSIKLSI